MRPGEGEGKNKDPKPAKKASKRDLRAVATDDEAPDSAREEFSTLRDSSPTLNQPVPMDSDTIPAPPMPMGDDAVDELLDFPPISSKPASTRRT